VERELLLTGIGGQGIQLAAQTVARAAAAQGLEAMVFGIYSGVMRGGNSDSSVVVADGPIQSPPVVSHAWSAMVMHHKYWGPLASRLRAPAVVVVNSTLFEGDLDRDAHRVFEVPATEVAAGLGDEMAASMVMVGAYAALTGLVDVEAAVAGMAESLPPYRRQHLAANEAAIRAGAGLVEPLAAPAWAEEAAEPAAAPGGRPR
jgi:Pyruvate/2-oxoacid:ferredoxin oxidoreductase gamma subunit